MLREDLTQLGLGRVATEIASIAEECVRLSTEESNDDEVPPGASKLGGRPDLPDHIEWPQWRGVPLSFIGQVNTETIPRSPGLRRLPDRTLLSFFYHPGQLTWGFDPNDIGSWRVIASPLEGPAMTRRDHPPLLEGDDIFRSCALSARVANSLPDPWSLPIEKLKLSKDESDLYFDIFEASIPPETVDGQHQLVGHPQQIQGDMQLKCQLVSHGLYCGNASGYDDPRRKMLEAGATDWRLLLQVDSDKRTGMMWGDSGRIYYWIKDEASRLGAFDEAWMVLQCY